MGWAVREEGLRGAVKLGRRRLRRLEHEVRETRADQAELRRRLELFEKIAEAAGAALADPVPAPPVPPSLLAAAGDPRQQGAPVRLAVEGREVIAVVGGKGDPSEWWAAIRRLALGARRDPP
jgi:hypothetical protein